MKFAKYILVLSSFFLLGGCAYTQTELPLNYQFNGTSSNAQLSKKHTTVKIGDIADTRGVASSNLLFHKSNQYGQPTTGEYISKVPLTQIVQKAVTRGMYDLGYKVSPNSKNYILTGNISSLTNQVNEGIIEGTYDVKITLNMKLIDGNNGKALWSDTITGAGETSAIMMTDSVVKNTLNKALTNAVHHLQESQGLYLALNNKSVA